MYVVADVFSMCVHKLKLIIRTAMGVVMMSPLLCVWMYICIYNNAYVLVYFYKLRLRPVTTVAEYRLLTR